MELFRENQIYKDINIVLSTFEHHPYFYSNALAMSSSGPLRTIYRPIFPT